MKKIVTALGLLVCLILLALAVVTMLTGQAPAMPMQTALVPLGYQQLTLTASAQALTVPSGATAAYIRVETANARWRDDGTNPTASVGEPLLSTDTTPLEYSGTLSALKFIAQSGSPVLDVVYYRVGG